MATSIAPMANLNPDALITLKVNFEGVTRRTKLPLRDMVPGTLETSVRTFLQIPDDVETRIERYSDSAAAYVYLEDSNVAVYKQLFRAAKAKSKLRIRVTATGQPQKTVPRPVTVEDEPEASTQTAPETKTEETPVEESPEAPKLVSPSPSPVDDAPPTPAAVVPQNETALPSRPNPISRIYDSAALSEAAKMICDRQDRHRAFESRLASLMDRQSAREEQSARLAQTVNSHCLPQKYNSPSIPWTQPTQTAPVPPMPRPSRCPAFNGAAFAVCCNSCEKTIPDTHYHCSTCDDGDYDLCPSCVEAGVTCRGKDHWLIKRTTINGQLVQSVTETILPKAKTKEQPKVKSGSESQAPSVTKKTVEPRWVSVVSMRTCNCCVQELPEHEFVHCTVCEDFDLCQPCFAKDAHGHHPKHGFTPAVKGTKMPDHITAKMAPGRNKMHHAICDGCDKYITGVRHKCLECPDWDYCASCVLNTNFTHPNHRFVPIYDQLMVVRSRPVSAVHIGICCDGPLCAGAEAYPAYIRGVRYKCAVCNDTDFCANCEASPLNTHNKTHPLIKFKSPVRHVSVTTTGEHEGGRRMPVMGDRNISVSNTTENAPETSENKINAVQTVMDVKPVEPCPVEAETKEVKKEEDTQPLISTIKPIEEQSLEATFVRDTVTDGTILPPNHVFEQTWVLRNDGKDAWPAGCSVKFVGGDYMGHVDSNRPAGVSELVSAAESSVCDTTVAPGEEFAFTVPLRTSARPGNLISYWRLTSADGFKFGHRLWCDVNVRMIEPEPKPEPEPKSEESEPEVKVESNQAEDSQASSQMIFPKLEKESPAASAYEASLAQPELMAREEKQSEAKESEDDWDLSDDGFMTDEEYDILDASDEEYLEEQKKKRATK